MAKDIIIKANGTDLASIPVTQNEYGVYYYSTKYGYYKPVLANFDNANPPSGYIKYSNGSHKNEPASGRYPIDFSLVAETGIAMTEDVKILYSSSSLGSYCKIQGLKSGKIIFLVHTYKWASIGSVVKAGNVICRVAPKSVTGYDPHLHIYGSGFLIRNLILYGNNMGKFSKNDHIKYTKLTNLRMDPDASSDATIIAQVSAGAVAKVLSGTRVNGGYNWNFVIFGNMAGWAFDSNAEKTNTTTITNNDGTKPGGNSSEYEAQIKELESEIKKLNDTILELNAQIKTLTSQATIDANKIILLESEKKQLEEDKIALEEQLKTCKADTLKNSTITELLVEAVNKIFGGK